MTRDISEVNNDNTFGSYLEKLARLIPAEVTAAFLAINTVLGTENTSVNINLAIISAIVLAILSPLLLVRFSGVTTRFQIFTAPVTFLIWACNIAIYRFDPSWEPDKVLPTMLILWTVILLFSAPRT